MGIVELVQMTNQWWAFAFIKAMGNLKAPIQKIYQACLCKNYSQVQIAFKTQDLDWQMHLLKTRENDTMEVPISLSTRGIFLKIL